MSVEEEEENNMIVQSQFLPAHLIGEMMSENLQKSKGPDKGQGPKGHEAPNYEALDE